MKKIRLIIPYFGKLPKFFPYFLLTAKRNQKIDFLIYTDQNIDQFEILNAENIEFKTLSFDDLRKKVQSKFDFEISLKTPYKLCDYKVAYGFIFEEELKGYDYWGFCDTDVLLGDIYQFLEEHSFFENDYSRYGLLGHLQIFKNSQEVNHVFMSGQGLNYRLDYHNVFTSEQNFIFDEADGIQKIFEKNNFKQLQDKFFDDIDISHFSFREYGENEHRLHPCRVWVKLAAFAHRLVDENGREFASDNGEHRDGIEGENQGHAKWLGCLYTELGIEVGRSPEEEEPPHAVSHETA